MQVAKLLLLDTHHRYLLLTRSNHPTVPQDPDIPGGIVEAGETPLQAVMREAEEEIGLALRADGAVLRAATKNYSRNNNEHILYSYQLTEPVNVAISWEHESYEWLKKERFVAKARHAIDQFMWLAADVIEDRVETEQEVICL